MPAEVFATTGNEETPTETRGKRAFRQTHLFVKYRTRKGFRPAAWQMVQPNKAET